MGNAEAVVSEPGTPAVLLAQADRFQLTDRANFATILSQLHREQSRLSPAQRWHLRYLDACLASLEGNLAKEEPILRDVIEHSGDAALATRATALLITGLAIGHHYEAAFKLANTLMVDLPQVKDSNAHAQALRAIVQMLDLAGEPDQALKYAQQLDPERASPENRCANYSYKINAISWSVTLSSNDPGLRRAIAVCLADKQDVYANTLRLSRADLLSDEGHPDQAIALLKRIEPSVLRSGFQPHISGLDISLAQAYVKLGKDGDARRSALAAVAASDPKSFTWPLQTAYELLYQIEKRAGDDRAALAYYEKYVRQEKAAMDDTKTRALAFQMVRQQVLDKKLKLEALDKKNRVLELRQELASKAQETSRLYIVLLSLVLVFIGLWTVRLKQSQLRFRRMARHDGLTGVFNRQHFLQESGRILQRLQQAGAGACLVVLDLDHFKRINDTYGHAAGDEALRRAVEVCRRELRTSDLLGRLGGEEFGILMPGCSTEQGVEIATRIRRALAGALLKLGPETAVVVSASLGLAHTTASSYTFQKLISHADAALYRAKHGGRNRLAVAGAGGNAPVLVNDEVRDAVGA
ncbi:MAG: GGDEF domain-containing protein [Pseudomonadota bacterium]|nr:GGDEF domain-containing protein [Xanthomonadaceae bacterium]MDE2248080.1 GGDEF domain-containing protein [Xanthomonadaceae bacterium]MDE3209441.1 GGDEF domain-containing protein [Pseudomonadota bacterium]